MPGFTTHTYVCYRALQSLSTGDSYEPFAAIAQSQADALVHAKANKPKELFKETKAVLAGCAYIGCCGPDMFYIEYDKEGDFIADLLHYNRTGPFIVRWLTNLRAKAKSLRSGLQSPLERQLAYCLGHISHIAADITIHPYVNSIVGAYPENQVVFKNARGMLPTKKWKFHNILEHYQDAYILHEKFIRAEGFGEHADCTNLGAPAAGYLRVQDRKEWLGFVAHTKNFYRYTTNLDIEKYKYDFFANQNTFVNVSGYYSDVIPDRDMMLAVPKLVQGDLNSSGAGVFDAYVDDAVALTVKIWQEVKAYLDLDAAVQPAFPGQLHRLSRAELQAFPILGQHWNLDCGLAPIATGGGRSEAIKNSTDSSLAMAGGLELMTAASSSRDDFK